jgi:dihydroxyacetone kinase
MTLRISTILALVASFSAAYAAACMSRAYAEILRGASLPRLTEVVTWRNGLGYWAIIPSIVVALYIVGERINDNRKKQRIAEAIMIVGTISTALFMIGAVLPLTRITVSLE